MLRTPRIFTLRFLTAVAHRLIFKRRGRLRGDVADARLRRFMIRDEIQDGTLRGVARSTHTRV